MTEHHLLSAYGSCAQDRAYDLVSIEQGRGWSLHHVTETAGVDLVSWVEYRIRTTQSCSRVLSPRRLIHIPSTSHIPLNRLIFFSLLLDTMYKYIKQKTAGILLGLKKQQGRKRSRQLFFKYKTY